jgi:hypothetical protein
MSVFFGITSSESHVPLSNQHYRRYHIICNMCISLFGGHPARGLGFAQSRQATMPVLGTPHLREDREPVPNFVHQQEAGRYTRHSFENVPTRPILVRLGGRLESQGVVAVRRRLGLSNCSSTCRRSRSRACARWRCCEHDVAPHDRQVWRAESGGLHDSVCLSTLIAFVNAACSAARAGCCICICICMLGKLVVMGMGAWFSNSTEF